MLRYVASAAALKAFSLPFARPLYRALGNHYGEKRRTAYDIRTPPSNYLLRATRMVALARQHDLVRDGARLLEIGTGWVHWEASVLRLFYDIEATLVDVWDNRQFDAFKAYLGQLEPHLDTEFDVDIARAQRAHGRLRQMLDARSFEELYAVTGFEYVVDPVGMLDVFEDDSFDLIVSCVVLEHIDRDILPRFVINNERILRPGGHTSHSIDLGDHLSYYDPRAHKKQYLAYNERTWKLFFENRVQYFNRVQKPEWLELFGATNLRLIVANEASRPLKGLHVAPCFRRFTDEELAVRTVLLIHEKPATDARAAA